jgi:gamma-glutamylcyclotransferase (GGCT)/AIG2-like uncharacterized protein YtfP
MFTKFFNFFRREYIPKKCDHLFVYGTLRREFQYKNLMSKLLSDHSEYIRDDVLKNYALGVIKNEYKHPIYPFAIPAEGKQIKGNIFKIVGNDTILFDLDFYEGFMYVRKVVKINDLWCYVYVVSNPKLHIWNEFIPSGDWIEYYDNYSSFPFDGYGQAQI